MAEGQHQFFNLVRVVFERTLINSSAQSSPEIVRTRSTSGVKLICVVF